MSGAGSVTQRKPNRLIHEASPYLLQHAYNPVDWYPWGPEALQRTRDENKPILLSIGYSACHWCHVMERESFEDPEIAALMNRHFINIKVDREERPDLDHIYQMACQAMTGQGGWPLTVFLTPDLRPFYAGTYFPPRDRYGRPGFPRLLEELARIWREDPDRIERVAAQMAQALGRLGRSPAAVVDAVDRADGAGGAGSAAPATPRPDASQLQPALIAEACQFLARHVDREEGGFGTAPKFPNVENLRLFLRYHHASGEPRYLDLVTLTLRKMAEGGIYDHLGGGFHRYSTDRRWLVPHFEKMLYDNALLPAVYLEALQIRHEPLFERVVRETLDYVLREMRHPDGALYSTQDADSEGEEGRFYLWTPDEVRQALGEPAASLFCEAYGVTEGGNFEGGRSVLHVAVPIDQLAQRRGISEAEAAGVLEQARRRLLRIREGRERPFRDEKVLTGWNALMIAAFARAGQVLGEPRYTEAAREAAQFLRDRLAPSPGRLLRHFKEAPSRIPGYLEDYAFLADALIDLYEATFERSWLAWAWELAQTMVEQFWDARDGGFFLTPAEGALEAPAFSRPKDSLDQSVPSGNGIAALALLRLHALTGEEELLRKAEHTLAAYAPQMRENPWGSASLLSALDFYLRGATEVVLVRPGTVPKKAVEELSSRIHRVYLPNRVLALREMGDDGVPARGLSGNDEAGDRASGHRAEAGDTAGDTVSGAGAAPREPRLSLLEDKEPVGGQLTAYVCRNFTCSPPVTRWEELETLLCGAPAAR